ncbi:MAG TPA: DUF2249 domain-containing protein [Segeticoccus sp.]|uniref:DUF2249 domain-containing protein n=1 Tax=Segeticoccus sp. TaxID=2706531 RepID=UPI002D7FF16A|nr:DUF2249 domain-containing protein [Segeticoccus sp.]HET8600933.1 DUF2249 domain-containing protein [Segeticoccus sp.]
MNSVVVATSAADSAAVEAVKQHHAELAASLATHAQALVAAAVEDRAGSSAAAVARQSLVTFCEAELVPHALAEEKAMYPLAHRDDRARLLIEAMLAEHRVITDLVRAVRDAPTPVHAAGFATALRVLFDSHLGKENDQVLPLLAADPAVSLQDVLGGMHELLGAAAHQHEHTHAHEGTDAAAHGESHSCGCGEGGCGGGAAYPELDARVVPHAIRHATVFGALDAVPDGAGLVLVAPHDPIPLLQQVEQRFAGRFSTEYLERGPEAWRILFTAG